MQGQSIIYVDIAQVQNKMLQKVQFCWQLSDSMELEGYKSTLTFTQGNNIV